MLNDGVTTTPFPGGGAGAPVLVSSGPDRIDGFVMKDHLVWAASLQEGPPGTYPIWPRRPYQLPGNRSETGNVPIAAVSADVGEIDVFGVGIGRFDGSILHWALRGGRWLQTALPAAGSKAAKVRPAAVTLGPGRVDVFATAEDGSILRWRRTGSSWEVLPALRIPNAGVRRALPPAVAVARPARLDVVAVDDVDRRFCRLWHWWGDDGRSFSGPEPVGGASELADVPLDAEWSGGAGQGLVGGMVLTVAAITDGGLAQPRTLVLWTQGPGRWAWQRIRRDHVLGFANSNQPAQVWLEASPPSIVPNSASAHVATVSALRNITEGDAFTRNVVVWNGDAPVLRVGRKGPTEGGLSVAVRGAGRVDALVDVVHDDQRGVLHVWSGHHRWSEAVVGRARDLAVTPPEAGERQLTWSIGDGWWTDFIIEYVVRCIDADGRRFFEKTTRALTLTVPDRHVRYRIGRGSHRYNPATGHIEYTPGPQEEIGRSPLKAVEVDVVLIDRWSAFIREWVGGPLGARSESARLDIAR